MRMNLLERQMVSSPVCLSSAQMCLDALVETVGHEASNLESIAAMTIGSGVFRLLRVGSLGLAANQSTRTLNILSYAGALSGEVSAFRATHTCFQILQDKIPHENVFDPNGWLTNAIDFSLLKGVGHWMGTRSVVLTHFAQANAMVWGHQLSAALGFTSHEKGSYLEKLAQAEAFNMALGAGMGLMHGLFPSLAMQQRNLDLHSQIYGEFSPAKLRSRISPQKSESILSLSMGAGSVPARRSLYPGGERPALVSDAEGMVSYADLAQEAKGVEGFLSRLAQGRRAEAVGMFFEGGNRREFFAISLAARQMGFTYSLFSRFMNPRLIVNELLEHDYQVLFLDSKGFDMFQPFFPLLGERGIHLVDIDNRQATILHYRDLLDESVPERSREEKENTAADLEAIIYRPVPFGFQREERSHGILENYSPFPIDPSDNHLVVDYLFHEGNLRLAYAHLEAGATVHMPKDRSIPNLHRLIEEARISTLLLHPWYVDRFHEEQSRNPRDLSSLRRVIVYAAHFNELQRRRAEEIFGRDVVHYIYSTTRQGLVSALRPGDLLSRPLSVGKVVTGVELEVRDESLRALPVGVPGRIYVRTTFTRGEFEATEETGFLDEEAYLTLKMSESQYPSTRGTLVDTHLVEQAIDRVPGVRESYVTGVSEAYSGERIVAALVLDAGADVDAARIRNYLIATLPDNRHVPKELVFLPAFPRRPDGTFDREAFVAGFIPH